MRLMRSINPATEELIAEYEENSAAEVGQILASSSTAFRDWSRRSFEDRAAPLASAARIMLERRHQLARRISQEMGKPIDQSVAEIEKCASVCNFYAENAERLLADVPGIGMSDLALTTSRPLGPVLAIMPWNFPYWQVFRFLAPTLMAGNVGILKHANTVQGCASDLIELIREAGFPTGTFQNLRLSDQATEALIADPTIRAVSLTGSTRAGRAVAAAAGRSLKKCVLELGGSDPYLILEDADLKLAVKCCVTSRLINTGQSCIAAKRFVVVKEIAAEFTELCLEEVSKKTQGDPLEDPSPDLGPLARKDLRDQLHRQVEQSVSQGARLLCGGEIPGGRGFFYPPTLLTEVSQDSPAACEELFGPVAAIMVVSDCDEAIAVANRTPYGLGGAVFTRDLARGERIAREEIHAGCCYVNDFVRSDPRLPFGGIGDSGYGRELAALGIHEFVNEKTISVSPGAE